MAQYSVLASEGRQRYIYTKTHKNIKEKKYFFLSISFFVYVFCPQAKMDLFLSFTVDSKMW
jgi:hypothetical protein